MEAPKREPIGRREPIDRERFEPRVQEYEERGPRGLALARDLTRWGPIFGGFVATIATSIVLSVFGAAVGFTSLGANGLTGPATIWGTIVMLIAFFVGGYVAARTAVPGNWVSAVFNSSLVWATSLVFGILLAAIGLGTLMGILGLSLTSGAAAPGAIAGANVVGAMWAALIGMVLALAAAIIGGVLGMHSDVESYEGPR